MVDVGRPDGVDWHLDRGRPESGEETVTIRIGQVVVHRCRLCPDGIWR